MRNHNINALFAIAALLTCICLAAGCAVKTPAAKVTDVEIDDITTRKVKLLFTVEIANPNPVTITISKVAYDFKAFGKTVAKDETDKDIRIAEDGESYFELPLTVKYSDLIGAGITTLTKGKLEYTLDMTITIKTPVGDITLPASKSGTIKSKDLGGLFGKIEGHGHEMEFDLGGANIKVDGAGAAINIY